MYTSKPLEGMAAMHFAYGLVETLGVTPCMPLQITGGEGGVIKPICRGHQGRPLHRDARGAIISLERIPRSELLGPVATIRSLTCVKASDSSNLASL